MRYLYHVYIPHCDIPIYDIFTRSERKAIERERRARMQARIKFVPSFRAPSPTYGRIQHSERTSRGPPIRCKQYDCNAQRAPARGAALRAVWARD